MVEYYSTCLLIFITKSMNSCILMAEIVQAPELRSTSDNQMEIAEMFVQFVNAKPENPPALIKVVGWNNLAREIKEKYRQGDRVIIEGRLEMSVTEKPEGYKEKRAQLVASRIHAFTGGENLASDMSASVAMSPTSESRPPAQSVPSATPRATKSPPAKAVESFEVSDDEIPF
jgi:single-strand DNA-binding protein